MVFMKESSVRPGSKWGSKEYLVPWISFGLAILVVALYFVSAIGVSRGATNVETQDQLFVTHCSEEDTRGVAQELLASDGCPNTISAFISFESFDPDSRTLRLWMRLYPQGDLGISLLNGGYFYNSLSVGHSSVGNGNWEIPSREWVGGKAIEIVLDSTTAQSSYPLDKFRGQFFIVVQNAVSGERVPVTLAVSQKRISGFEITPEILAKEYSSGNDNFAVFPDGLAVMEFEVARASGQHTQLLLLIMIIVIGVAASLFTTVAVVRRRRPPSLGALAWLATYLFALIQVRAEFPGEPPIGLSLDRFLTFPAIAIVMGLIVVNAFMWFRRDDWDSENQDAAVEEN
jgi:hypothetical protein